MDLAPVPSPVALFLPRLRSPTLARSVQGISPSVLGVPLYSTQMAIQAPRMSNTMLGLSLAVTSLAVTSCSTRRAFICIDHVFKQNRSCFATEENLIRNRRVYLPALPLCCGRLLMINQLTSKHEHYGETSQGVQASTSVHCKKNNLSS